METTRGFLNVNYDDGEAHTFKGLTLSYGDKKKLFNTGDPLVDFYDYHKFVYSGQAEEEGMAGIGYSSSVDHFFMDTDEYEDRRMTIIADKVVILSEDVEGDDILRVVIHKDMKSFDELKEYVKSKRV